MEIDEREQDELQQLFSLITLQYSRYLFVALITVQACCTGRWVNKSLQLVVIYA